MWLREKNRLGPMTICLCEDKSGTVSPDIVSDCLLFLPQSLTPHGRLGPLMALATETTKCASDVSLPLNYMKQRNYTESMTNPR